MRARLVIATAGALLALFGVFRLLTQVSWSDLAYLVLWLVGALIIHDAVVSPTILLTGKWLTSRVPPRARRYLQGALIAGGIVTVIAIPMIYRAHSQPTVKAILEQNFVANLGWLLAAITVGAVLAYVARVVRDHRARPRPDRSAVGPAPLDPADPANS